MAATIGAKLNLQGEAQFKQALREINQNLKVLSSELDLTAAKFDGQDKSIDGLGAKYNDLSRIYEQQEQKVMQLRKALEHAADEYGDADTKTQNWRIQLNKAQTELEKTRKRLDETNRELESFSGAADTAEEEAKELGESTEEVGEGFTGLGDLLNELGSKFGVQLPSNMNLTAKGLDGIGGKATLLMGGLALLAGAIVEVEKKLINLTKEAGENADEILRMKSVYSISAQTLQEYQYAADFLNVSTETLTQSHLEITKSMADAKAGTTERINAFMELGVAYQNVDGTLRDSEEVFWEVIDALGNVTNETERDSLAMKLLSESAAELNPLIEAGSDRMKELAQEAQDMGYVMSDDALGALQKSDDAMARLDKTTEAAKNKLSVEFAPYLTEATDSIAEMVGALGEVLVDSGVVKAFGELLTTITEILNPIDELNGGKLDGLARSFQPVAKVIATISDTLKVVAGILRFFSGDFSAGIDMIKTGLGANTVNGKPSALYLAEYPGSTPTATNNAYYNGMYYGNQEAARYQEWLDKGSPEGNYDYWKQKNGYNASGNENWRGGMTWVGENGPERVYLPQGSQILTAQESREPEQMTMYVTINARDVKEFNDIVKLAKEARMRSRKG